MFFDSSPVATAVAALLMLLLCDSTAEAQSGTLEGRVLSKESGLPVAGAVVEIGDGAAADTTDAEGRFAVRAVPVGSRSLVATAGGYLTARVFVDIAAGETARSDVLLREDPVALEGFTVTGTRSRVGTRFATPVLETAQAISVVSDEVLQEQLVRDLPEVVRNVSGTIQASPTTFAMRGFFSNSDGNFRKNGIETWRGAGQVVGSNVERVEVLKGPASVRYGRLDPGGVINIVTKQPRSVPGQRVEFRSGSHGYAEGRVDFTGPLTADPSLLYRLNASFMKRESHRDAVEADELLVAPVVTWSRGTSTRLTLEGEYRRGTSTSDQGIAAPQAGFDHLDEVPVSRFLGEPAARSDVRYTSGLATLEQDLDSRWTLRAVLSATNHEQEPRTVNLGAVADDGQTISRRAVTAERSYDYRSVDVGLLGRVETGSLRHRIAAGASLERTRYSTVESAGVIAPIDLLDPVYSGIPTTLAPSVDATQDIDLLGVYLQDHVEIGETVHLQAGVRFTTFDQTNRNRLADSDVSFTAAEVTPSLGAVWRAAPGTSLYASWGKSFAPTLNFDAEGKPFDPSFGYQYEVGVKQELLERRLAVTLAVFELENTGRLSFVRDENGAFQAIQGGVQRSRGIEVDAAGEVRSGWTVIGSYAFLDAGVVEDPVYEKGRLLGGAPRHSGSLWTQVHFGPASLGGGYFYTGSWKSFTSGEDDALLPSYGTVDLSGAFRFGRGLAAQVGLTNVLDERYYLSGVGRHIAMPGAPRSLRLAVGFEF